MTANPVTGAIIGSFDEAELYLLATPWLDTHV